METENHPGTNTETDLKAKNMENIRTNNYGEYVIIEYKGECVSRDELSEMRSACVRTASEIMDNGETPVILSLPPMDLGSCLDGCAAYLWHEAVNLELYKIAAENGFQYIDITTPLISKGKAMLASDGVRLSDEGHRYVNDIVKSELLAF